MVQLFYYEQRGKCFRKLLRYEGDKTKVFLYPYEGWAQPALTPYWILKTSWWNKNRCKIVEINGGRKNRAKGKMTDKGNGVTLITGEFKHGQNKAFRVSMTTDVSASDFQLGYCVTGTLERGNKRNGQLLLTHFVMVKRKGY